MAKTTKKGIDEDALKAKLQSLLVDAVGVQDTKLASKSAKALELYNRDPLEGDYNKDGEVSHPGRSLYVSSEVHERLNWSVAVLLKLYDTQNNVVLYLPNQPQDQPLADQMNAVANFTVRNKNSHVAILEPWLFNGFLTGLGVVMAEFRADPKEGKKQRFEGLTDEDLVKYTDLESAGKIKIVAQAQRTLDAPTLPPGLRAEAQALFAAMPPQRVWDIEIRSISINPKLNICNLAPEDFIVSKDATIDQQTGGICATLQGHKRLITRAELLEQKFDKEKVASLPNALDASDPLAIQRDAMIDYDRARGSDQVFVYEIFTKIALDDDTRRHYRITLGGDIDSNPIYLAHEEVTEFYPYAPFVPYPIPNTLFGHGIVDIIGPQQTMISRFTRGMINNLNLYIDPPKFVRDDSGAYRDMQQMWPGKAVKVEDPAKDIQFMNVPFTGPAALQIIESLKQDIDFNTGVGGQMMSVNPSDLQNTTATAASQRENSQQLLMERVARYFADTGYRYLFRIIVDLLKNDPENAQKYIARLTGGYTPIQIDDWDPDMDMTATVGFGVSDRFTKNVVLNNLYSLQMAHQGDGLANPQAVFHTLSKIAENSGYGSEAFFLDPSKQPPKAPQPPPVPPEVQAVQAQSAAQLQDKREERQHKMEIEDKKLALEHERMLQDFALESARIQGQFQTQVDAQKSAETEAILQHYANLEIAKQEQKSAIIQAHMAQQAPQAGPQQPPMPPQQ